MIKSRGRIALIALCGALVAAMLWVALPSTPATADTGSGWTGYYYPNTTLSGTPSVTRTESAINFNWGSGSPDPSLPPGAFSARWTLQTAFTGGLYNFQAGASGGIRVYIDSILIIDQIHTTSGFTTYTAEANLAAGNHALEV